jgi:hypothetical protein
VLNGQSDTVSSSSPFSALGSSPGISDDGQIVAFYGVLSENVNGTNVDDPGIFVAFKNDSGWHVQRVAGVAGNGYFDPGETMVGGIDQGMIGSFDPASRVGVGMIGSDQVTISYVAFDAAGHKGIYTSQLTPIKNDTGAVQSYDVSEQSLVVDTSKPIQVGQAQVSVQDLAVYAPINKNGQIAFWAKAADGSEVVLRANVARTPVLFVPGVGGTYAIDDNQWVLSRGLLPNQLVLDPLAHSYDDLIASLQNAGYTLGKDLFPVTYDWRLAPAPTDSTFDGKIDGLKPSIHDISAGQFTSVRVPAPAGSTRDVHAHRVFRQVLGRVECGKSKQHFWDSLRPCRGDRNR